MSSSFLGGLLESSTFAGTSSSKASTKEWSAKLVSMLRVDGAPDFFNLLPAVSMAITKQPLQWVMNSIFKSSTFDFARSTMRRTPS